jgi:hypothetical protein
MDIKGIGIGDDVFITGLFSFVAGVDKNLPVVRTGNLAMVPSERVPSKKWHKDGLARSLSHRIRVHAAAASGLSRRRHH